MKWYSTKLSLQKNMTQNMKLIAVVVVIEVVVIVAALVIICSRLVIVAALEIEGR